MSQTVIFFLFVTTSLASSIGSYLSDKPYNYDFTLLSVAVGLVYSYGLGVPAAIWALMRYLGVTEWGLVEWLAVWGYGMTVWYESPFECVRSVLIPPIGFPSACFASRLSHSYAGYWSVSQQFYQVTSSSAMSILC